MEKNLGAMLDENLIMSWQCVLEAHKASHTLSCCHGLTTETRTSASKEAWPTCKGR